MATFGPSHPKTAFCLNNLAGLSCLEGDFEGSSPNFQRAVEITETFLPPTHPMRSRVLKNYGAALRKLGF